MNIRKTKCVIALVTLLAIVGLGGFGRADNSLIKRVGKAWVYQPSVALFNRSCVLCHVNFNEPLYESAHTPLQVSRAALKDN